MMKEMMPFFIFIALCLATYWIFSNISIQEGMVGGGMVGGGIAGGAAAYAASLKSQAVKLQDTMLVSKYRNDYENAILNLDDLIDHLMLSTALNVDPKDHAASIDALSKLNGAKSALNNVMKFIDGK